MEATAEMLQITCHEKGRQDTFEAEVAADCTGNEVLKGLVEAGYLAAPSGNRKYSLINGRSGSEIPTNMSLQDAEVKDGEVLRVTSDLHGA